MTTAYKLNKKARRILVSSLIYEVHFLSKDGVIRDCIDIRRSTKDYSIIRFSKTSNLPLSYLEEL